MTDRAKLSAEAQKLIELTSHDGHPNQDVDLAAILQQYPHLMAGLNEYTTWRDAAMEYIAKEQSSQPVGHQINEALKELGKPQK